MKGIDNINSKGELHGYLEWYRDDKVSFRGTAKNGEPIGYNEFHLMSQTRFFIK